MLSEVQELLRGLRRYSRGQRGAVIAIAAALFLESAFGVFVPVAFGRLIDEVIPQRDTGGLTVLLVILGVGAVIVAAGGVFRDYLYARVQSGVLRDMRVGMFAHLQRLSLDYFARTHPGDILTRFSGDVATLDNALMAAPPWVLLPLFDVALATAVLFWLDWRLALVAMLIWPAAFVGPRVFGTRAMQASDARKRDEADALSAVHENVAAQPTVRVFLLANNALRSFAGRVEQLAGSSLRLTFLSAMVERSAGIGVSVLRVVVLGVGALMAFRGTITLGVLAGFQAVFLSLSASLSWIAMYLPTVVQAGGSMRRVQELLDAAPDPVGEADGPPHLRMHNDLEFRDVTFEYTSGRAALSALTLRIPCGISAAIVGPSGSGKSTLLSLMLRLHDPTSGSVCVDGRDLRAGSLASWREQIGVVSQDSFLFSASVRENIRVGRAGATDADVEAAARAAEIHEFIISMPNGYETMVGEGGMRLSGGQRQRLAIARALVRDPGILVLDEATSALDTTTESAVNATLRRMTASRTVISVTHRLSAAAECDRIFVIDRGRLAEEGSHAELVARRGVYASLWEKQRGFLAAGEGSRVLVTPEGLRRVPLLSRLDEGTLTELATLFVPEHSPASRVLVYQGDAAEKFYIVVRGRLEVVRANPEGSETRVAVLEDGDHFGEIGLLLDVPRNATCRTLTECTCLVLDRQQFREIIARVPELRNELVRAMEARQPGTTAPIAAAVIR